MENLGKKIAPSKVLIIGPSYFNFNRSIERAFEALDWTFHTESYDTPIHPFNGLMKWKRKFSLNRKKLKKRQNAKFNVHAVNVFRKLQPDLVFILNGEILSADTLDFFRETSKVALWMYDTLSRCPASKNHIDHVDAFFSYEKADVDAYLSQGKTAHFLPQACDENDYYPTNTPRDIDILFVGFLYRYNKRIKLLKAVTNTFPDKKILIIGIYKPWYKNPFKWLFREKRHIYTNKNIPVSEVNNYYNRARIVLNIHHETQQQGANPKVFEICGAGAYQICDTNPFIKTLFTNGEVGLYRNETELLTCIEDALQNDKSENARHARQIVLTEHTFTHRIKELLAQMKFSPKNSLMLVE
ncbi:MAG: glycosyltransferase [Dysgonamonadaceae bacterium]|jgi:spore maturation protein CgeB|nr:glycosyltransferase [Dysgonamonadaceae bacterium]